MTPPVTIEPVRADLYRSLAEFNAHFEDESRPVEFWMDRFRSWWDDNPAWDDRAVRGWTLITGENIVGFVGLFPSYFQLNGAETRAWISTTWRVHDAYRGQSLKLMSAVVSSAGNQLLFSTTARREIAPVMHVLGYRRMPALGGRRSLLVVDAARVAAVVGVRAVSAMARACGPVVRRVHFRVFALLARPGVHVRQVYAADGAFDALWDRTCRQYPTATVRNATWVNWQCFANRWFAKEVVAAYDGSHLRGFAVALAAEWKGLKVLDCIDLWYDFDDPAVAVALMRGLADLAIARNCHVVQVPHFNEAVGRALSSRGLFSANREAIVGYWRGPKPVIDGSTTQNVYLTLIEGDRYL
jgi:hypothetical protein